MTEDHQLWLAALPEAVPEAEARLYWNLKDDPTPVLSDGLRRAAYLHLGAWGEQHESEEPQAGLCPAVRVFDWLFYIGTIPIYQAPRLDAELSVKLLDLYEERPGDLASVTAGPADLRAFIERHQGKYLLMEEQPPQVGKPCN